MINPNWKCTTDYLIIVSTFNYWNRLSRKAICMIFLEILTSGLNEIVFLKHVFVLVIFFGINAEVNGWHCTIYSLEVIKLYDFDTFKGETSSVPQTVMLRKPHCRFSKYSVHFVAGSKEKTLDLDVENLGLDPTNRSLRMKSTCLKFNRI